jgi:hypothetical protein
MTTIIAFQKNLNLLSKSRNTEKTSPSVVIAQNSTMRTECVRTATMLKEEPRKLPYALILTEPSMLKEFVKTAI